MTFHPHSNYAITILESARKQGKYWEALNVMFEKQPIWGSHEAPKPELLLTYMKDLGLNLQQLQDSMKDQEIQSKILQDRDDGARLGVNATPTVFVNGHKMTTLSNESLLEAINKGAK